MRGQFTYSKTELKGEFEELDAFLEEETMDFLESIAQSAIQFAKGGYGGVDTGAYITSFSFITGRGRPRGKSSHGRPRGQSPDRMARIGLDQLLADLRKVDLKTTTSITLSNNAPHADIVEYKHGKYVFSKLRKMYG